MKVGRLIGHAYTMLRRELGCGEYRLTLFALLVGVISVTALSLTTSRIQNAMQGQAVDMIGGDTVLRSTTTIDDSIFDLANSNKLSTSLSVSSFTMASHNDDFLLSSVRAVDDSYPLKGAVSTQVTRDSEPVSEKARPAVGEAWVEKRFLDRLGVELGDEIEVGLAKFKLTKILQLEPDRSGSLYALNPRVLINWQDLEQTKLVQPGSRLWYKLMLSGEEDDVEQFIESVSGQLNSSQRLVEPQGAEDQINENLTRANAFINLGALLSVILCGIAVSLAASRHARRHIDQVALLRCFGLKSSQVNWLYTLQLLLISIPAILLGLAIGYLVHGALMQLIEGLFTRTLPSASLGAWFSGPITALCMVLGFGLPPLLRLATTPPARIFRKELSPRSAYPWFGAVFALLALILIAWWQTEDLYLACVTILGLVVVILVLSLLIIGLLKLATRLHFSYAPIRGAFANLASRPSLTATQIVGFGVSLFAIVLIIFFKNDVFEQWNKQVPDDAPNRFVFDLSAEDRQTFSDVLTDNGIYARIFPTVRGRLVKINGEVVQKAVSKEGNQDQEALNRDLSLTQTDELPPENTIIAGLFEAAPALNSDNSMVPVSIESQLAEQLEVSLGDELEFLIQRQRVVATVTSLREVNWENFRPNFYMIFPVGTLDQFSQSSLTSFYLPKDKLDLDKQLNKQFVGASIIDVDFIIKRIQNILKQVSSAMQLTFGMAIVAGMAVFWAALLMAFEEKQQQAALLRALGASRKTVGVRFLSEQVIIGALSGLLTAACLLIVSYLLSTQVLELAWQVPWLYMLALPVVMMALLAGLSSLQLGKILRQAPYPILKQVN